MSEQEKDRMLELLSDKAVFGLSEAELAEIAELEKDFPGLNDESFELAAASIGMLNLDTSESMPAHLRTKIAADAEKYFAAQKQENAVAESQVKNDEELQKTFVFEPKRSIRQWLGWAVAAAACIVLAINIYTTQRKLDELAKAAATPTATPKLTAAQEREQLLASASDIKLSNWGDLDQKNPKNIQGDVVWSNEKQKGFVRFSNLPVNDKTKEQYQVWIFDESQKQPIDGGVFDASEAGEIIIPIEAKLKVQKPQMIAITAEKPGGVVVSSREKVMAVAKVST